MKIALIHSIYHPYRRGGAEVAVETIAAGLQALGHQVSVITVGYQTALEEIGGVRVYRIKPFNLFNFLDINKQPVGKRFFWHIIDMFNDVQAWRIYKVLKQQQPDLIWGHNLKGLGYYVPRLARILKIKYIQSIHDMQYLHPSGLLTDAWRLGLGARIYGWFCRQLLSSPELVVFPSKFMKRIYDSKGFFPRSREVVLGNPISLLPQMPPLAAKETVNCLYLGQVEKYKGIFDLIESFKSLAGTIILNVVGEGSALSAAKEMAGDDERIKFWGRLNQEELEKNIWPVTDLLINPSRVSESFGLVVLEAFAHGIPVIAGAIGALPELVAEGQTGWLILPGDKEALKNKLQGIIDGKLIDEQMKEKCLARAMDFEVGHYLEKLFKLISTE